MATIVRLRMLSGVLKQGKPLWLTISVILASFWGAGRISHHPATALRYGGSFLEAAGLVLVAKGISETRRLFGRPSLKEHLSNWLRGWKAVLVGPTIVSGTGHAMLGRLTMTGELTMVKKAGANASIDERVTVVEENLDRLRADADNRFVKVQKSINSVNEKIEQENAARQRAQKEADHRLEKFGAEGLPLELAGLVWLFLGMICTNLTEEVARLLQ